MDNKLFSCGIFIGLQKAFDTVDHEILLMIGFTHISHVGLNQLKLVLRCQRKRMDNVAFLRGQF